MQFQTLKSVFSITILLFLVSCASTKNSDILINTKINGPKIIAIDGVRTPWLHEIEKRLRKNGFTVKRMVSQNLSIEKVNSKVTRTYNEASAPYILYVDGYAPNNAMERCYGGGYRFDHIDVELIDVLKNETILTYSNSGYSEGCPPLSGSIFGDIVGLINSVWNK